MDSEEQKEQDTAPNPKLSGDFSNFYTKKPEEIAKEAKYVAPKGSFIAKHKKFFAIVLSLLVYAIIVLLFIFGYEWSIRKSSSSMQSTPVAGPPPGASVNP